MPPDLQQGIERSETARATAQSLDRVRAHVLARFQTWFPGLAFDASGARLELRPLGEAATYPLYVCSVFPTGAGDVKSLVVKFTPVFSGHQEGRVEFEHLSLMYQRLGGTGELRVPRPLDFLPDVNVLITERVGGERFSRVLLREATHGAPAAASARLVAASRRCGAWLHAYHETVARGSMPAFGGDFESRVSEGLATLGGFGLPGDAREPALAATRSLLAWGRDRSVPVAVQHGDFGPQNVHVADDHICVFDPSHHVEASAYDDIDYFLVTLETLNPYPRAWRFDRARVRALREPFLEGYFGERARELETRVLVEGYYLKALVARGLKQRRNTAKRGGLALWLYDHLWLRSAYARALRIQAARCQALAGAPARGTAVS